VASGVVRRGGGTESQAKDKKEDHTSHRIVIIVVGNKEGSVSEIKGEQNLRGESKRDVR